MKIRIKRIDTSLPLPKYETSGACCFDLTVRQAMVIKPKSLGLIPMNIIIEVPEGYMFIIASRSSTPKDKGLLPPHGIGIIDQDYRGPQDEVMFQVYNYTDADVTVFKGERLAQGCIIPVMRAEIEEVVQVQSDKNRGGFGTTG